MSGHVKMKKDQVKGHEMKSRLALTTRFNKDELAALREFDTFETWVEEATEGLLKPGVGDLPSVGEFLKTDDAKLDAAASKAWNAILVSSSDSEEFIVVYVRRFREARDLLQHVPKSTFEK